MAVIYDKETDMTDLQRRVTAELEQRLERTSSDETSTSDGAVKDSADSNRMERLPSWAWLIVLVAVIVVALFVAVGH